MEAWLGRLRDGDGATAWVLFEQRYRRLILATVRRLVHDPEDIQDIFADIRLTLSADDFARLRRWSDGGASVATWLVVVVRNLTIDWLRRTQGRRTHRIPAGLADHHRLIYQALCLERLHPTTAFEEVQARGGPRMSFAQFLREVRAVRQSHPCPEAMPPRQPVRDVPEIPVPSNDPAEALDLARRLDSLMATQPPDVRLAIQLYVVDDLPASEVASIVGWPNPKAVYNRVRRALDALRAVLEREGVGRGDL